MEAIMQVIVKRENNDVAFAERLHATMTAFQVSGATGIRFLQLGDGSVLVMGQREATGRDVADAEKAGDGSSDNPFSAAVKQPLTAELLFRIIKNTLGMQGQDVERVSLVTAVRMARGWSPATVRLVLNDVEGFLARVLKASGFDQALDNAGRLHGAVEGLRLAGPAAPG